jgi:hypothetical protein
MAARYCRRAFDIGLDECDVGEDLIGGAVRVKGMASVFQRAIRNVTHLI